jgi:universal stress protein A
MSGYKKTVIALSLHEESDQALLKKAAVQFSSSGECHLVHAAEYMVSYEAAFGVHGGVDTEELRKEEAGAYIKRLAKQFGFGDKNQTVIIGPPAASLVDYAKEHGIDLIVMGNHGHHGLKLLKGSTADGVMHHAPCDILALHLP